MAANPPSASNNNSAMDLDAMPSTASPECRSFVLKLRRSGMRWGWVQTNENPSDPSSKPVDVFYYYRLKEGVTPVVLFNGGPMASSHEFLPAMSLNQSPFVAIDQRGNGCSTAYPEKVKGREHQYMLWGTTNIVEDAELVRQTLNIDRWDAFGHSYGGMIVQRYLEKYPESILSAATNGGGMVNFEAQVGTKTPFADLRSEHQIKVVKAFFDEYPESKNKVATILRKRLCSRGDESTRFCGALALNLLSKDLSVTKHWSGINQVIHQIYTDNVSKPLNSKSQESQTLRMSENRFGSPEGSSIGNSAGNSADNISSAIRTSTRVEDESTLQENKEALRIATINRYLVLEFSGEDLRLLNQNKFRRLGLRMLGQSELLAMTEAWWTKNLSDVDDVENLDRDNKKLLRSMGLNKINTSTIRNNLNQLQDVSLTMWSGLYDAHTPRAMLAMSCAQVGPSCSLVKLDTIGHEYHQDLFQFISTPSYRSALGEQ